MFFSCAIFKYIYYTHGDSIFKDNLHLYIKYIKLQMCGHRMK